MDDRDEEPVVIYHSHTATEAYPSRTDISYAGEPEAHYVLVSTRDPDATEFRSFRIVDGVVTEEPVRSSMRRGRVRESTCSGRHRRDASTTMSLSGRQRPTRVTTRSRSITAWPSRSASRPSCAPTPAARRPSSATGDTLAELIDDLDARHPGLERPADHRDGALHRFVNVYVNDEDVRFLGGLDTPVADGDTVTILPAVAGGASLRPTAGA